jgi:hypothetical protein
MSRPEYSDWSRMIQRIDASEDTALNLAAAVGNYAGYAVSMPVALNRLSFIVTTAVTSGSVNAQVAFKRFPTYASTTGSVSIGSLIIPNASAVGTVVYKDVAYVKINAGEELMIQKGVQAVDAGTAAGAGFVNFTFEPAPDAEVNQSNMVKSG